MTTPEREKVRQKKLTCTQKTASRDFFSYSIKSSQENRSQAPELHQRNRLTTTKIASGIPYWPSRDPIGEGGGLNLHGFVNNSGINKYDYLGLKDLEVSGEFKYSVDAADDVESVSSSQTMKFTYIIGNIKCEEGKVSYDDAKVKSFDANGLDSIGLSVIAVGITVSDFVTVWARPTTGIKCPNGGLGSRVKYRINVKWKKRYSIGFNPGIGPFSFDTGASIGKTLIIAERVDEIWLSCCCPKGTNPPKYTLTTVTTIGKVKGGSTIEGVYGQRVTDISKK